MNAHFITTRIADAFREVTASMQNAIAEGHRSRQIDADDLIEVLLAIADCLDPPLPDQVGDLVAPANGCPACGERSTDRLVWQEDDSVRCARCGTAYRPG